MSLQMRLYELEKAEIEEVKKGRFVSALYLHSERMRLMEKRQAEGFRRIIDQNKHVV